jgi:hypothetical protein
MMKADPAAIARCPRSLGSATATAAPQTQVSCNAVSERENARERNVSATSRWMTESSDTFPKELVADVTVIQTTAAVRLNVATVTRNVTPQAARQDMIRTSGRVTLILAPLTVPTNWPNPPPSRAALNATVARNPCQVCSM